jgi:hypothetical protein
MKNTTGVITSMKRISSQLTLLTPAWKAVGAVGGGDALGQGAEIGALAGGQHHARGRAADHVGAHEAQVVQLQRAAGVEVAG